MFLSVLDGVWMFVVGVHSGLFHLKGFQVAKWTGEVKRIIGFMLTVLWRSFMNKLLDVKNDVCHRVMSSCSILYHLQGTAW